MGNDREQRASATRITRVAGWKSGDEDGSSNEYMQEMVRRTEEHHLLMKQLVIRHISEIALASQEASQPLAGLLVIPGGLSGSTYRLSVSAGRAYFQH